MCVPTSVETLNLKTAVNNYYVQKVEFADLYIKS